MRACRAIALSAQASVLVSAGMDGSQKLTGTEAQCIQLPAGSCRKFLSKSREKARHLVS